jgi:hypothetical protein
MKRLEESDYLGDLEGISSRIYQLRSLVPHSLRHSPLRYVEGKMNYLTLRTEEIASHYFPSETEWAIQELQAFCEDLSEYFSGDDTPESYERFCFAVLKSGKSSKEKFSQAIELGRSDYRDLLVGAGFGNSTTIHNDWAQKITKQKT